MIHICEGRRSWTDVAPMESLVCMCSVMPLMDLCAFVESGLLAVVASGTMSIADAKSQEQNFCRLFSEARRYEDWGRKCDIVESTMMAANVRSLAVSYISRN